MPVEISAMQEQSNIQSKWLKLIELGYKTRFCDSAAEFLQHKRY